MITAGLDIGSLMTKVAVLKDNEVIGYDVSVTGDNNNRAAELALSKVLGQAGICLEDVDAVVVTGAGKDEISFANRKVTDVECLARGAFFLDPDMRGVIDMGGQSTRVLKLEGKGLVVDFALNDKCASGTGIFLDAIAKLMGLELDEMGPLSLESTKNVTITSTCVVFAESEVISQVHRQTPKKDILNGLHKSIATRIYNMFGRIGLDGQVMATGGLAKNTGILACLEDMMQTNLTVQNNPQTVAALGAALIAAKTGGQ